ncbi:MAG: hypothetical protein WCO60_12975 [Verrucomicrobiota bacterium]
MLTNFLGKVTCFASEGLGCVGHGGGLMGVAGACVWEISDVVQVAAGGGN